MITSCGHLYCHACLTDLQHYACRKGSECARCSACGEEYTSVSPCDALDTFEQEANSTEMSAEPLGKKKPKKDKSGDMDDWIGLTGEVLPSAKTQGTKAQILNWLEADPNCKIIIFTLFLPMVRIMAKVCQTEGWTFCKYTVGTAPIPETMSELTYRIHRVRCRTRAERSRS